MFAYALMIETEEDKVKFENLYRDYRQIMFYEANRILDDEYMAEDAVHLAFMKVLKNMQKINPQKCHKTRKFLVIIVRNVSINIYNRNKGFDHCELYDDFEDCGNKGSPESVSIENEDYNNLVDSILTLGSKYSDILFLKYSHDYSNKEIAKMLDITEEVVRKRLERAKTKLMAKLQEGAKES